MEFGDDVVGIVGQVRGSMPAFRTALAALDKEGVRTILQLGNLGLVRPNLNVDERLGGLLRKGGFTLAFLDGADDPEKLRLAKPARERAVHLTDHVRYLPPGSRGWLSEWLSWASLGGTDLGSPAQAVTTKDVEKLGVGPIDVLFTHLPPYGIPKLEGPDSRRSESRAAVTAAHLLLRPKILVTTGDHLYTRTYGFLGVAGPFAAGSWSSLLPRPRQRPSFLRRRTGAYSYSTAAACRSSFLKT